MAAEKNDDDAFTGSIEIIQCGGKQTVVPGRKTMSRYFRSATKGVSFTVRALGYLYLHAEGRRDSESLERILRVYVPSVGIIHVYFAVRRIMPSPPRTTSVLIQPVAGPVHVVWDSIGSQVRFAQRVSDSSLASSSRRSCESVGAPSALNRMPGVFKTSERG